MPDATRRSNARSFTVRAAVAHFLAHGKGLMRLVARTIGLARARVRVGLATLATNMRLFAQLDGHPSQPE